MAQPGWLKLLFTANYNLPPNSASIEVLRVVVRENMSEDLIDLYITDLMSITEDLMKSDTPARTLASLSFSNAHRTSEAAASTSGHAEGEATKATGYSRQC